MDERPVELKLIPHSSIQTGRTIGEGGFGTVLLAHHKDWGDVALKKLKVDFVDESIRKKLMKEARKLNRLRHPNIVLMFGVVMEDTCSAIVLEYMLHGALDSFLETYETSWAMKLDFINGIVLAMNYLHTLSSPIIHRDLKPPNVLVGRDLNVKVTDFGLSKWRSYSNTSSHMRLNGTVTHVPPEVWGNLSLALAPSYDIYSFAVLVWEVCTEEIPFEGVLHPLIKAGVQEGQRPGLGHLPAGTPPVLHAVIEDCWHQQPQLRPAFHIIKDKLHPTWQAVNIKEERRNLMEQITSSEGDSMLHSMQEDGILSLVDTGVSDLPNHVEVTPHVDDTPHAMSHLNQNGGQALPDQSNTPGEVVLDRPLVMGVQPVHPASTDLVGNNVRLDPTAVATPQPGTDGCWDEQQSLHMSLVEPETVSEIHESPTQGGMTPNQSGVAPGQVGLAPGRIGMVRPEIGTTQAQAQVPRQVAPSQTFVKTPVDSAPRTTLPPASMATLSRQSIPALTGGTQPPHHTEADAQPESLQPPTSPVETMPTTAESFSRTRNGTVPGNPHVNASHPRHQGAAHNQNLPGSTKNLMPKLKLEIPDLSKCDSCVVHQSDELGTTVIYSPENSQSKNNNIQIGKHNVMNVYSDTTPPLSLQLQPLRYREPSSDTETDGPSAAPPVSGPLPTDDITRSTVPLDSANMELVSKHLGRYWKALGRRLSFSSGELDQINADYHTDGLEEKIHQMLEKWKVKEGRGATIGVLATKLWSIERYGLAAMLK